jgi:hypothetical protein
VQSGTQHSPRPTQHPNKPQAARVAAAAVLRASGAGRRCVVRRTCTHLSHLTLHLSHLDTGRWGLNTPCRLAPAAASGPWAGSKQAGRSPAAAAAWPRIIGACWACCTCFASFAMHGLHGLHATHATYYLCGRLLQADAAKGQGGGIAAKLRSGAGVPTAATHP